MKRGTTWSAGFVLSAALMTAFWGCSDDSSTSGGGGNGGASASSSQQGPGPGSNAVSTGSGEQTTLGISCISDVDCGDEERCILSTEDSPVLSGGAVNGYCTKDCLSDGDCGSSGRCRIPSGQSQGECFQTCAIGPALQFIDDPLEPTKCHGRADARCTTINGGSDVCIPNCGVSGQCGGGRVCDPRSGACVDTANIGKPLGAVCDDLAANEDGCAGFCQTFTGDSDSICTSPCVLGGDIDGDDCGGLSNGLCVYRPSGYGPGDFGRCAAACSSHDQCGNPDWWCSANDFAPQGFCFTTDDCPNGVECDPTEQCTQTKYGPKCLQIDVSSCGAGGSGGQGGCQLIFPLGDAAPAGGSGGLGGQGGSGGQGGQGGV